MLDIPRRLALLALSLLTVAIPAPADAQMPGMMGYFAALRRWTGDRMEPPAPTERPTTPILAQSDFLPLAVHGDETVSAEEAQIALEAMELAYMVFEEAGYAPPPTDGGRGGTADFDLYLEPSRGPRAEGAGADPRALFTFLDSAPAFAWTDPQLPGQALSTCVTAAYAEALLIGQDPAEAIGWRRATATYLTWLVTGEWGCDDGRIAEEQRAAHRGFVGDDPDHVDAGALLLAELSLRHDGGSGRFVHDVWQVARQRTWEGAGLRASPDLWEAIDAILEVSDDDIDTLIEDVAVARYFTGARAQGTGVRRWARTLPNDALVPVSESFAWDELSKYTRPHEPEIAPFGSAYVEVDVSDAPVGERLRLWLRGEFGVRWSFVAVSLDASGAEIGRMAAPPRRLTRSYLQLDFMDERTAKVVVVITNLSARLPDADEPDENARSFRVILDKRDNSE